MAQERPRLNDIPQEDQHLRQLIDDVAGLLELSDDFEVAWEIAHRVCDRYGIGRAAA